jgi:hypothetical protein
LLPFQVTLELERLQSFRAIPELGSSKLESLMLESLKLESLKLESLKVFRETPE